MISIAMTTYNGEKYLKEQINSILNQVYKDFELIICDDCSNDSTWEILTEYEQLDKRIKIYRNDQNLGFLKNFEKVISLCTGDYIATSDQDDIWEECHLQILYDTIKNGVAAAGESLLIDSDGKSLNRYMTKDVSGYEIDVDSERKLLHLLFCSNPFSGAVCLFKKSVFDNAFPIPDGVDYQDTWFTACALCMGEFNYVPEIVTKHRLHGNNTSGNQNTRFWDRVKRTLTKEFTTDRIVFCEELPKRFPMLTIEKQKVLIFAENFLKARLKKKKFTAIKIIIKNYKTMYASTSRTNALLRCIQILVRN